MVPLVLGFLRLDSSETILAGEATAYEVSLFGGSPTLHYVFQLKQLGINFL